MALPALQDDPELNAQLADEMESDLPDVSSPQPLTPGAISPELALSRAEAVFQDLKLQQQALETARMGSQENLRQMEEQTAPQREGVTQAAQQVGQVAQNIIDTQKAPTLPEPPRMQNFLNRDAASMMLSIGTLIGGINSNGSIRSIRANQALAASINGFMAGNYKVAELGLVDWKNQMEKQVKEFDMIRQNNNDILNASGKSLEAKRFELQMAMAPFGMKQKLFDNQRTFIADAVKLDHELFEINGAMARGIGAANVALDKLPLERQKWEIRARAMGYPTFSAVPPNIQNQIMNEVAAIKPEAYAQAQIDRATRMRTNVPIDPKNTMNWINENGQTPQADPRFVNNPTAATPEQLTASGYRFFSDPNVARAYRQSFQALTQLKRIETSVNKLYEGVGPGTNIANAVALKIRRGMGDKEALELKRTILETLPTMALAEGMTAGRVGEAILGEFELPQFPTDKDTYESAINAVHVLQQRLGNNIQIFRGTGVNPALVSEAVGRAEAGQGAPGKTTQPTKPTSSMMTIREKATNRKVQYPRSEGVPDGWEEVK